MKYATNITAEALSMYGELSQEPDVMAVHEFWLTQLRDYPISCTEASETVRVISIQGAHRAGCVDVAFGDYQGEIAPDIFVLGRSLDFTLAKELLASLTEAVFIASRVDSGAETMEEIVSKYAG